MTFPAVVGTPTTTAQSTANTVRNIDLPTGITAGERIIIVITTDNAGAVTFTPPTGFSAIAGAASSSTVCNGAAFEKIATGSESGTITCTVSTSCTNSMACAYRVSGAHASTVSEAAATTGTSTTPNPPSKTPSWGSDDTLWIAAFGKRASSALNTYPANYTTDQTSNNINNIRTAMATRQVAASSEDPGSYGIASSVGWHAITIAVRPSAVVAISYPRLERGVRGLMRGVAGGNFS